MSGSSRAPGGLLFNLRGHRKCPECDSGWMTMNGGCYVRDGWWVIDYGCRSCSYTHLYRGARLSAPGDKI